MANVAPTKQDYRNAMAQLGAAASIVTTSGGAGRAGFTASAVCSVADDPPILLVCLNRSASVYETFQRNGHLCVNVLTSEHIGLAGIFGGRTDSEARFAAASWTAMETGSPVLESSAVAFDCRIENVVPVQSHDILLCRVLALKQRACGQSLIYFNRSFHTVSVATSPRIELRTQSPT
ncbi:flavin reductase [Bradyrhizobium sp. AS23.2]|uniref:flavin reductase n=1 Tax=Bradyrhizobium sp. AS23.2 TaxID=1680155 RepID=UPI00093FA906|nr:flavin reductase [Bradyrhizobium sp. AS23.2]